MPNPDVKIITPLGLTQRLGNHPVIQEAVERHGLGDPQALVDFLNDPEVRKVMEQFDDATGRIGELCETVRTKLKGVSKLLELRHPDINRNELNAVLDDPFSSTSEDVVRKILDTILPKGGLVADYEGDTRLLPLLEALSSLWDAMYDVSGQP